MERFECCNGSCGVPDYLYEDMDEVAARKLKGWMARMGEGKPPDGMDTDAPGTSAREMGGY